METPAGTSSRAPSAGTDNGLSQNVRKSAYSATPSNKSASGNIHNTRISDFFMGSTDGVTSDKRDFTVFAGGEHLVGA
jgi:hypothetical protein